MGQQSFVNPALNQRWLKWATFWVEYRERMRRIGIGIVVVIETALLLYAAYGALDYFLLSRVRDEQQLALFTTTDSSVPLHRARAPRPVQPSAVVALPGSSREGRYDVLIKFTNPNPQWVAWVTYRVGESTVETVFVPNDGERFAIAVDAASSPAGAPGVTVEGIAWQRIRDVAALGEVTPRFSVTGVTYTPGESASVPGYVRFTAENVGLVGYWRVGFTVVLLQGEQAVAARRLVLDEVRVREPRTVTVNFFSAIYGVTDVLVVPDVVTVDESNIVSEPGGTMAP